MNCRTIKQYRQIPRYWDIHADELQHHFFQQKVTRDHRMSLFLVNVALEVRCVNKVCTQSSLDVYEMLPLITNTLLI